MIATEGQPGLWFNTMADNNIADGKMAMYLGLELCVCCVCICMHGCAGGSREACL